MKKIFGVVGYPINHTLSPAIHNYLFGQFKMEAVYLAFEVPPAQYEHFFKGMACINNLVGLNVTVPFKNEAAQYTDRIIFKKKDVFGAVPVNTVHFKNKISFGFNTDIYGFYMGLLKSCPSFRPKRKIALLIGAGGAAKGVGISLVSAGIKCLVIANRTYKKAVDLKSFLEKISRLTEIKAIPLSGDILSSQGPFDLIINSTSHGLKKERSLINFNVRGIRSGIAYDLIYKPKTDFLIQAEKNGWETVNGLDMLIFQAFKAFQIWTGKNPIKYYTDIKKILLKMM
ncbi:MAG: shikimate dehydrogenase [Spirochaetes bacterium]|nr:shikimate dehydrogenase [Spirochaetota bacterium]